MIQFYVKQNIVRKSSVWSIKYFDPWFPMDPKMCSSRIYTAIQLVNIPTEHQQLKIEDILDVKGRVSSTMASTCRSVLFQTDSSIPWSDICMDQGWPDTTNWKHLALFTFWDYFLIEWDKRLFLEFDYRKPERRCHDDDPDPDTLMFDAREQRLSDEGEG